MRRYDDDYTGDLERALYGRRVTLPRRRLAGELLDAEISRAVADWLAFAFFRRTCPEFAGSRIASIGRAVFLADLAFIVVWVALGVAGVVPWFN